MEFRDIRKGTRKGIPNNNAGRKKIPSFYEECLRKSDYSQTIKDFYFKNKYRYVYIPERLWNSDAFIKKIKSNYKAYLNDD